MSLTITRNYSDNTILTEQQLDDAFDDVETKFNVTKIAGSEIQSGTIAADNLALNAVTAAKLDTNAVTTAKIQDDAVTNAKIADSAVNTDQLAANAVTRPKMAAVGQQVSASCGLYIFSSTSYVTPTNLSVSLTTTGRPVMLLLVAASDADGSVIQSNDYLIARFVRDSTGLGEMYLHRFGFNRHENLIGFDVPSAGTYTYTFQIKVPAGTSSGIYRYSLVAYEL